MSMIQNILALIDSGKEENIEMATHLSVNLPAEWKWLSRYLVAKNRLPKQMPSWYAVYCESVVFGMDRVQLVFHRGNGIFSKVDDLIFSMSEIQQNVADELHFMLFRINQEDLLKDIISIKRMHRQTIYTPNPTDPKVLKILDAMRNMLPRS